MAIDFNGTTPEAARANVLESATFQCNFRNDDLKRRFQTQFDRWCQNCIDRPAQTPDVPPQPLNGFEVKNDEDGWAVVVQGDKPVCPVPPIPPAVQAALGLEHPSVPPDVPDIGANLGGNWYAVGPHDTKKPGDTVDTPMGKFVYVGAPVGKGWYLKIG